MQATCIAGVSLIRGIGRILGMDVLEDPAFTGGFDTDMDAKARAAIELMETRDFVLLNVKAPDIASHDSDPGAKIEVIERIDSMVALLRKNLSDEVVMAFTADHCTPIETGDHSGDPVPVIVYSKSGVRDEVKSYDEASCARGGLGRIGGVDLLPVLVDRANRSEKFGA